MKVTVDLDLGDVLAEGGSGKPITLLDLVITEAARQVVDTIDESAKSQFRSGIQRVTDEEIRRQVEPLVAEALAGDVEPTFGAKRVPLRQHIMDVVRSSLQWREGRYDSDSSMLVKLVRKEVGGVLDGELRAELEAAKEIVRAAVREKGAEWLADTASKLAATR